jgi:hypothetical protein
VPGQRERTCVFIITISKIIYIIYQPLLFQSSATEIVQRRQFSETTQIKREKGRNRRKKEKGGERGKRKGKKEKESWDILLFLFKI